MDNAGHETGKIRHKKISNFLEIHDSVIFNDYFNIWNLLTKSLYLSLRLTL